MKVQQFYKGIFVFICIIMVFTITSTVFAAMDPLEVEERNEQAPFLVIGEVTSDELFLEVTEERLIKFGLKKSSI